MKKMQCEICGSNEIKMISDGLFGCQSCGVQYDATEVKKLLVDIPAPISDSKNISAAPVSTQGNNSSSELNSPTSTGESFSMTVMDSMFLSGRGIMAVGHIDSGTVRVGESVYINGEEHKVAAIEQLRRQLDEAKAGMTVGLLLGDTKGKLPSGTVITD